MEMIIQMLQNTKLDVVKESWLQGKVYLLLHRFHPTIFRGCQLF